MLAFEEHEEATYSVAWIDCLSKGESLGRSILYLGEPVNADTAMAARPSEEPLVMRRRRNLVVPVDFPGVALNSFTMRGFNSAYYNLPRHYQSFVDLDVFYYPLDSVLGWNKLYGRRGFFQYQCVFPDETSHEGCRRLLEETSRFGRASFLAVLKRFGEQDGLLSFPMRGYTLAMDFPVCSATLDLATRLDSVVEGMGGRLYLAKDSRMESGFFSRTYSGALDRFLSVKQQLDPTMKFSSEQSGRLGIG